MDGGIGRHTEKIRGVKGYIAIILLCAGSNPAPCKSGSCSRHWMKNTCIRVFIELAVRCEIKLLGGRKKEARAYNPNW